MKGKISHTNRLKHWLAGLCLLFITFSAHATAILNWTNVYYGVYGWPLVVPNLKISVANNQYAVSWLSDSNYVLKSSTNLNGPWSSYFGVN
ncbi:MAG TPA: hypothetical protein VH255_09110, partial [Verrucomicrobiae bacterium]|nr:hypothetical protein [Verrucomicrobiae bacterium]